MSYLAVITTIDDRNAAEQMADLIVARRLAACAQISEIQSVYRWQEEVRKDREFRVLFKTTSDRYDDIQRAILELHSYELPAVHAFALQRVYAPYADWIESHCGSITDAE